MDPSSINSALGVFQQVLTVLTTVILLCMITRILISRHETYYTKLTMLVKRGIFHSSLRFETTNKGIAIDFTNKGWFSISHNNKIHIFGPSKDSLSIHRYTEGASDQIASLKWRGPTFTYRVKGSTKKTEYRISAEEWENSPEEFVKDIAFVFPKIEGLDVAGQVMEIRRIPFRSPTFDNILLRDL